MLDGLLIIDKPSGPTSHDVVARMRRVLREPRIGHTGTLDPLATGVLLLVVGKATRLAKFLSASDKSYDAVVRLGFATDTADVLGQPLRPIHTGPMPSRAEIETALEGFRGTFQQQPPAFSAKKIDGQRSYKLARAARDTRLKPSRGLPDALDLPDPARPALPARPASAVLPAAVSVTTHRLEIVSVEADSVTLRVDCSAGFYIRSLAHDLGERLGTGAHLTALRRTRTGAFTLDQAVTLDAVERESHQAAVSLLPLAGMLPDLPSVVLTAEGINRVAHGQDIRPGDVVTTLNVQVSPLTGQPSRLRSLIDLTSYGEARQSAEGATAAALSQPFVRLLGPAGNLVAVAEPAGVAGVLHPSVVLM